MPFPLPATGGKNFAFEMSLHLDSAVFQLIALMGFFNMGWLHGNLGRALSGIALASALWVYSPEVIGSSATKEWQTPGCISPPYPTVPAGPTASIVVTGQLPATYQVRITAWRVPCGPADHQLLFTLEPIAGTPRPLLLTIQFIQNNQQYMAFAFRTPDPLLVPSTVLMEVDPPPGGGTEFDDDLAFEAVFIDTLAGIVGRLPVPAAPVNGTTGPLGKV